MIKRIELINFMSHAHTVIEPAAGLTVLVGPNNCGKSAVVAALQILCHNDNSTYVLRHQAPNCQIIVETAEGHVIEWSRKKSGSPRYTINGKPFDRLKRSVPPELHAALRLPKVTSDRQEFDVHFGEQKRPVFLLNDSAGAAAEFFASSSDTIRLVEMQALHKLRIRDAKRDLTNLRDEKKTVAAKIEILAPAQKLDGQIVLSEKQFLELAVAAEEIAAIENTITQMVKGHKNLLYRESQVGYFGDLQSPPEFQNTRELETLLQQLAKTNAQADQAIASTGALTDLAPPPDLDDEPELEQLLSQITASTRRAQLDQSKSRLFEQVTPAPELAPAAPLEELISDFAYQHKTIIKLNQKLDSIARNLELIQNDICQWAKANPICPTCHGRVEANNLVPLADDAGGRP